MKKFFANKCMWYCHDGVCGCPNKDRSRRAARIGVVDVDVTWDGRCVKPDVAADIAAGRITPPLACDDAEKAGTTHFCRNAGRGYMKAVGLVNDCWSYLFSCEWCYSFSDMWFATLLFAALVPITPFVYLCVAPFVALLEGTREEGE